MLWPFEYASPRSAGEVSKLLAGNRGAKVFAGGTNLIVDMETGVYRPPLVVDIKKVEGVDALEVPRSGPAFIGAGITVNRLIDCKDAFWPCLKEAGMVTATYQVRNRATMAGNLCNASPAADLAPPMLVLGSRVRIHGPGGATRTVPLEQFFVGVKKTVLKDGEFVLGLEVDEHPRSVRTAFLKKQRIKGHDLAIVNLAGLCDPSRGRLRVAVGACAVTPLLFDLDDLCSSKLKPGRLLELALERIVPALKPVSDVRATAEYRRDMVELFARKVLDTIWLGAR